MATRGYFSIQDASGYEDTVNIEAWHDGYYDDILQSILMIQFTLHYLAKENIFPEFFYYRLFKDERTKTFEYLKRSFQSMIPVEELSHPSGIYNMLVLTTPKQFQLFNIGDERYGHPVSKETVEEIVLKCNGNRVDSNVLKFDPISYQKDEKYYEELTIRFKFLVEFLNSFLENTEIKFVDEHTIQFSFHEILIDLLVRDVENTNKASIKKQLWDLWEEKRPDL
jgi:hypothetical protein